MTIQELARQYADIFITKRIFYGEYLCLKKDNEELVKIIQKIHGGMFPDNFKYQFIYESLELIANKKDDEEIYDIKVAPDFSQVRLLKWISSNLVRSTYVDDAVQENGYDDFFVSLANGQLREKKEVLYNMYALLEESLKCQIRPIM